MGLQEKKNIIRQLSEQGKTRGQLCTTEILDALGDVAFNVRQMEKLYDTLKAQGIEIVEDLGARSDLSYIIGPDECNADAIGAYLKAVSEVPPVTPEEETELVRRIGEGDVEAQRRLAEGYLRLSVQIAGRYQHRGLHLLDLLQEGNMGLVRATKQFDPAQGYSFAVCATWWIRDAVLRAIAEQEKAAAIPENDEEVHTGGYIDGTDPLAPDNSTTDMQAEMERIAEVMEKMSPLERQVICLRFGLNGERPHTLEEVAGQLNVTRERVRQLERKALWKGRPHVQRRKRLKDFLD